MAAARAFWSSRAVSKTASEIKTAHMMERSVDKQGRWSVRKNVTADGVVSNLYGISVDRDAVVHRYDLDVSRRSRANTLATTAANNPLAPVPTDALAAPATHVRKNLPVSPTRAWRMYAQSLRRYPSLPPLVRVSGRVYAAGPLPPELLELPKEYHDLGWERCCLTPAGPERLHRLPPGELKSVVNKMLPWALSYHSRRDGSFAVVRELDGKMVCTEDGISVAGLRIFRGTTATILHVTNGDVLNATEELGAVPTSKGLGDLTEPGVTIRTALAVRCHSLLRMFTHKGKTIGVYLVQDASGTTKLTLWGVTADTLVPGQNYDVIGVKTKAATPTITVPGDAGATPDLPMEIEGTMTFTKVVALDAPNGGNGGNNGGSGDLITTADGKLSAGLALRLDTRCTVASEKSLWEEVRQHFGDGPYDADKQKLITRALQGTPVILSTNLRHTSVRSVRFDFATPQDAPMDAHLRSLYSQLDPHQPYAVVSDYSVVPVQALHCCYDPRMRSWQEVTVPACSFMPLKRHDVLQKFRGALTDGLKLFGVSLDDDALATKSLSLLEEPMKPRAIAAAAAHQTPGVPQSEQQKAQASIAASLRQQQQQNRPRLRTVALVAIAHPRSSKDDTDRLRKTADTLAKVFRTQFVTTVPGEQEAAAYIDKVLCQNGRPVDPDCAAIFVTPERESRPARWLQAECLRRGVMPEFVRGASGDRRQKLIAETIKMRLLERLAVDPVKELSLINEVPLLAKRTTLVVGIDACHTHDITTGCCVGMLIQPSGNSMHVQFWRNHVRGKEIEQISNHFGAVIAAANAVAPIDEVVVFQDGDVYAELESMKARLPPTANLSFLCLHKRTHVRFVHRRGNKDANVIKGAVIESLTPTIVGAGAATGDDGNAVAPNVPSFFLQCHDCFMSTARTVQYKVHHTSPQFSMTDLQKLSFALAHVASPQSTKLPLPTRCAHRLSAIAERLVDANPSFRSTMIPEPLNRRLWFM